MGNSQSYSIKNFGADNNIYLQTDRPCYVGGQQVNGNIYLNIQAQQFNTKGIFLTLFGSQHAKWTEEKHRDVPDGTNADGSPKTKRETYYETYSERRQFFKCRMCVHNFRGPIMFGQYTFPFQFVLPEHLPGNYQEQNNSKTGYFAEVKYQLEAECDSSGFFARDILYRQPIVIDAALRESIQAVSEERTANVTQWCCIKKGDATMRVHFDKNCYAPGETAYIICEADNRSTVDFKKIKVKFMRALTLRAEGRQKVIREELTRAEFEGVKAETNATGDQARRVPIRLIDRTDGVLEPQTDADLVTCKYTVEVQFDIPYAPDITIRLPVTIYAPQPPLDQWGVQAPPAYWHPNAQNVFPVQNVAFNYQQGAGVFTGAQC